MAKGETCELRYHPPIGSAEEQSFDAGKALAKALEVNAVLTKLNVEYNRMGNEGEKALRDAAKGREGFELII